MYVLDKGNNRVERFSSSGAFLGQFNAGGTYEVEGKIETSSLKPASPLLEPASIAVDNSQNPSDPSAGDVYVADAGREPVTEQESIDKFSPTGEFIAQLPAVFPEEEDYIGGLTVDSAGNLWASLNYAFSRSSTTTLKPTTCSMRYLTSTMGARV